MKKGRKVNTTFTLLYSRYRVTVTIIKNGYFKFEFNDKSLLFVTIKYIVLDTRI